MSAKAQDVAGSRNPDRTRRRILDAAFKEFFAHGYAGGRVDVIARRAKINKRMLYHYFGDKQKLYRAVVYRKISDRMESVETRAMEAEATSRLALWFQQNCADAGWVRLLAWESLQTKNDKVLGERERRRIVARVIARIRKKQSTGWLRKDVSAMHIYVAKLSLTMFPMAMPQLIRLITGYSPDDPKFQREYSRFLETIVTGLPPP